MDGTGYFLVYNLKKILNPEAVIDKQIPFVPLIRIDTAIFKIIDDIFNDKDKGLPFGSGKI